MKRQQQGRVHGRSTALESAPTGDQE
jgi:hypothetical protein